MCEAVKIVIFISVYGERGALWDDYWVRSTRLSYWKNAGLSVCQWLYGRTRTWTFYTVNTGFIGSLGTKMFIQYSVQYIGYTKLFYMRTTDLCDLRKREIKNPQGVHVMQWFSEPGLGDPNLELGRTLATPHRYH